MKPNIGDMVAVDIGCGPILGVVIEHRHLDPPTFNTYKIEWCVKHNTIEWYDTERVTEMRKRFLDLRGNI